MATEGSALSRGKPDPNVVMPESVKRAADRANELAKQAEEAKKANPAASENVKVEVPPTINSSGTQVTNFDPANPAPPPEPPPPASSPAPAPAEDIAHQFKSLQGRYSKADEENRRMAQQVSDLQRLLATVQTPPQQPQQPGSGVRFTGPVATPRVSPKEVEEYGKEFIDVVGRRAMEVQEATLQPMLTQLQQELMGLKQVLGGVRQVQASDATERMWSILDREVPNWQQINNSGEFVRWLQSPDPLAGQIRHGMLKEAFDSQQVGRVAEFFRRFLSDQAASGLQGQGFQPGNGAIAASTPQLDLMSLAAPGRAKAGQTTVTPEKPTYSRADIAAFYKDKTFGKFAGREAEASALERDLIAASTEGRIRT